MKQRTQKTMKFRRPVNSGFNRRRHDKPQPGAALQSNRSGAASLSVNIAWRRPRRRPESRFVVPVEEIDVTENLTAAIAQELAQRLERELKRAANTQLQMEYQDEADLAVISA